MDGTTDTDGTTRRHALRSAAVASTGMLLGVATLSGSAAATDGAVSYLTMDVDEGARLQVAEKRGERDVTCARNSATGTDAHPAWSYDRRGSRTGERGVAFFPHRGEEHAGRYRVASAAECTATGLTYAELRGPERHDGPGLPAFASDRR